MWTLSIDMFIPTNDKYDYRLKITAARDASVVLVKYDTDAIFLWQKDAQRPESDPITVDYFTNVCSVADLTIRPDVSLATPEDTLYRKNEIDLIFRSKDVMMDCVSLILADISQLKAAINNVIAVTDDADYNTNP